MAEQKDRPYYSAVVPVGRRTDDLVALVAEYRDALASTGASYEIIVVFDGRREQAKRFLSSEIGTGERVRVIELTRQFGESAALTAGFDRAAGEVIVTLPAYYQVDPAALAGFLAGTRDRDDMLVAVRWPRAGSRLEKWRRETFHRLFEFVSRMRFRDLGCGVRVLTKEVTAEIPLYGDQHRFLPALATRRGFQVREVEVAQSQKDHFRGRYRIREYLHGFLDVLTVFFLVRFTKKPLRFFGMIGCGAAGVGGLFLLVMVFQRLAFDIPLGDRPALLLASLLVVLGVQVIAIGLIGELIIFTHAAQMKEYAIRSLIDHTGSRTGAEGWKAGTENEPSGERNATAR